jgi:hypothetical protein
MTKQFVKQRAKEIQNDINDFLEFVYLDLKKSSLGDRMKWTTFCLEKLCEDGELEKNLALWHGNDTLAKCQTALRVLVNKILRGDQSISFIDDVKTEIYAKGKEGQPIEEWKIHVVQRCSHKELEILMQFALLINEIPPHAHRTCKGCGRYFVKFTEGKRMFCGNLCASRYHSRKRRGK